MRELRSDVVDNAVLKWYGHVECLKEEWMIKRVYESSEEVKIVEVDHM